MADYDIAAAFAEIEDELLSSMMRNFSRHRAEETAEGYNWAQWQAMQLKSLEKYRSDNQRKLGKRFSSINEKIEEMLRQTRADGNAAQETELLEAVSQGFKTLTTPSGSLTAVFFGLNDRKLDALIKATVSDMERAEHAVLRLSHDKYRSAIFNAQVYMNTGAATYEKAVDMAVRDLMRAGLNCVEYKNGARHTLEDYAEMAIRTANKRAYLMGEGEKRKEFGITTVVVNSRLGGCPRCARYIGRVFIDDVYSGGTKADGNYPLLSEAIEGGLFHPRCKDSTSTYYEGITTLKTVSGEEMKEMERREQLEQKESYCRNEAKKNRRISQYSLDRENKRAFAHRADVYEEKAEKYAKELENSGSNHEINDTNDSEIINEYANKATPGVGNITFDENYSIKRHSAEIDFAEWIETYYGGDVHLLEEANENKVKTPDYLWNGKYWELKTVSTEKSADNAIRSAIKQIAKNPGGVFLNYGENEVSIDLVEKIVNDRISRYKSISMDVIIVRKGKVVKILRYKK